MRTDDIQNLPEHSIIHVKYCPFCANKFYANNDNAKFCCNACKDAYNNVLKRKPELKGFASYEIPLSEIWRFVVKEKLLHQFRTLRVEGSFQIGIYMVSTLYLRGI